MGTTIEWTAGRKPWNWTGKPIVASNGYVLVFVGKAHHLADVRGYAYEHRVVAEQLLGRELLAGEQIHHINGVKTDNRPANLEVTAGIAHHRVKHRKKQGLRLPGERNPIVACACGCGVMFTKYDGNGRPRRYVSGHNKPERRSDGRYSN